MTFEAPVWIPTSERMPERKDADEYGVVWAIAMDARDRHYPSETHYKHVRNRSVYTHWAMPEKGKRE